MATTEKEDSTNQLLQKHSHVLGIRLSALFEILIFFGLLFLWDYFWGEGNRFADYSLHPCWIIILLVTAQYGTIEGLVAVLFSTLFLYAGNIPDQQTEETLFDYELRLALVPTAWFISAYILGEIRMRLESEKQNLKKNFETARQEAQTITEAYEDLKAHKENLEIILAGQLKTSALTYKTFKSLGTLNPALILLSLENVIRPLLNPKKFSLYSLGPSGLEPANNYGWEEDEKFTRRFPSDTALYREIIGKQRLLCIINPDDEKILAHEGILAAPLIDPESGEIFGMLKIEEIDFLELNISNLEIFKTMCELIGMAYSNARQHQKLASTSLYSLTEILHSYAFYQLQSVYLKNLAEQMRFPLTQLTITEYKTSTEVEEALFYLLLKEVLPLTTQVFHGKRKTGEIYILFSGQTHDQVAQYPSLILDATQNNDILSHQIPKFEITALYSPGSSPLLNKPDAPVEAPSKALETLSHAEPQASSPGESSNEFSPSTANNQTVQQTASLPSLPLYPKASEAFSQLNALKKPETIDNPETPPDSPSSSHAQAPHSPNAPSTPGSPLTP